MSFPSDSTIFSGQLSNLIIDANKDWGGYNLTNVGSVAALSLAVSHATLGVDLTGASAIQLTEAATVPGGDPVPSRGKLWLKTTVPNQLWFTDDIGGDVQLGAGGGDSGLNVNYGVVPIIETAPGIPVDIRRDGIGNQPTVIATDVALALSNATDPTGPSVRETSPVINFKSKYHPGTSVKLGQFTLGSHTDGGPGAAKVSLIFGTQHTDSNVWKKLMSLVWKQGGGDRPVIDYCAGGFLQLGGNPSSHVGTTGAPTFVAERIEANTTLYADGASEFVGTMSSSRVGIAMRLASNGEVQFGANLNGIRYATGQTNDHMQMGVGGGGVSGLWLLCDRDQWGTDYAIASQAGPVLGVHDNSATGANWGGFLHDGTNLATIHGAGGFNITADLIHTGSKVGFFSATPVVQPTVTGSRAGNAALASLLTALADEGLIVDSSTA